MTRQPRRILVRSTNWLGDAVMTTPALLRLRERFPAASIILLTHEKLRDLWDGHPAVDAVMSFHSQESVFAVSKRIRAAAFDLALVFPNSPRSALEAWLGRIPQRVGYARSWRNWFLTTAVPTRPGHMRMQKRTVAEVQEIVSGAVVGAGRRAGGEKQATPQSHHIFEYLHLVGALGGKVEPLPPRLEVSAAEVSAVVDKFNLRQQLGGSGLILGLNPGAEYGPAKRWPAEKFIAAAREIQRRTGCTWLIFGGKGDVELAQRIESGIQTPPSEIRNVAGQTSLRELMALLKLCRALLTNDTGPMHLAAALDTPVVVPFGSTSPVLTGPGLPGDLRHRLIKSDASCAPCFLRECPIDFRCMNGISPEQVVAAVLACV